MERIGTAGAYGTFAYETAHGWIWHGFLFTTLDEARDAARRAGY